MSRFFSLSFFESLSADMGLSGSKITAAATTGPLKHPRPASSHPHSMRPISRYANKFAIGFKIAK
jgi:hypothetical protein